MIFGILELCSWIFNAVFSVACFRFSVTVGTMEKDIAVDKRGLEKVYWKSKK